MTTIASSTTNPVEIVSAISERLSMLYPSRYIRQKCRSARAARRRLGSPLSEIPQEEEHDENDQPDGDHQREFQSAIEARIVVVRSIITVKSIAGEIEALSCGSKRANTIHGVDDVGAGLPEDNDQHGGFAVRQTRIAQVLDGVLHVGDIGKPNRPPCR